MTTDRFVPDDQLLGLYADALNALEKCKGKVGRIEMELLHRMEERGATSIPNDTFICEAPLRYEYPLGCFMPLVVERNRLPAARRIRFTKR